MNLHVAKQQRPCPPRPWRAVGTKVFRSSRPPLRFGNPALSGAPTVPQGALVSPCRVGYIAGDRRVYALPGHGEVAEWSIAPHSKCGIRATVSGVRIPPSPPSSEEMLLIVDF